MLMTAKNYPSIAEAYQQIHACARTGVKNAEIGGGQDAPFEGAFSNLAHAYLRDKAPSLLDYELGFQLLDRNQENTKAAGIFGFKVGSQFLYAPVFFLNGKLKGHELLYIKAEDLFVPLKENWLNYILNRRPDILGSGVDRNLQNLGAMPPHLYQLSRSPHKFANAREKMAALDFWAQEIMPQYARWATVHPRDDARYKELSDLPTFLKKAGVDVLQSMLKFFLEYPQTKEAFNKFHDDNIINETLATLKAEVEEANSDSVLKTANYPGCGSGKKKRPMPKYITLPGGKKKRAAVEILTYDEVLHHGTGLHKLDSKDRDKLMKENILVKDERPDTSVAYEVQTQVQMQNPDETAIYDVLTRPQKIERCLIVMGPFSQNRRELFCTVVRLDGEKSWLNIHPSHIWTTRKYDRSSLRKYLDELPEAEELSKGGVHMLVSPSFDATLPFSVDKSVGDGSHKSYDVYFRRHAEFNGRAGVTQDYKYDGATQNWYDKWYLDRGSRITFTNTGSTKMRATGADLYIGDDVRLLTLKKDDDSCCFSDPPPIVPGDMLDVESMLGQKTAMLKLYSNGTEVQVNGQPMGKVAALIHLIRDHDLREAQARYMLKTADDAGVARYRIKYSDSYYDLQKSGPSAPGIPDPYIGTDALTGNRVPTQHFTEYNLGIPDMSALNTDPSIYLPMGPEPKYQSSWPDGPPAPDEGARQQVMNAAQSGQREVFDTAMIGSLLKTVRDDNLVDRYMPDLMKGMDRLGRILFLFYWHNEKFAERYGQADMIELEDGLRNAFEDMGDIVLFLRQQAIDAYPDELGNPDIQDMAST